MKKVLLTMLIVFLGLALAAQEMRIPSAIISAGGSTGDGQEVNFSRWRIGQVHALTIPVDQFAMDNDPDWKVSAYPNPVIDFLLLEFELPEARELDLEITDVSGRLIFKQEAGQFIDGSISEINMSLYPPALYLLRISSADMESRRILRIQKL